MTRLLYQQESYLMQFTAKVTCCKMSEKNGRWLVALDSTAFYPEGGGQPADTGTLAQARVLDTQLQDGEVWHLTDQPLQVGTVVQGMVDAERRFDHMQQHSGEHIVSGLLHQLFGLNNVGFHLGADQVTIDLDGPLTADQLEEVERKANQVVFQNLPVRAFWPSSEQYGQLEYRSKKQIDEGLRLVEIPGVDCCACCGVHVVHTGEVGFIKICSAQSYKGGMRLGLVCGGRAVALAMQEHRQVAAISAQLSVKQPQVAQAVCQLAQRENAERERANRMQSLYLRQKAQQYAQKPFVFCTQEGMPGDTVREYVLALREAGCELAVVLGGTRQAPVYALCGEEEKAAATHDEMKRTLGCRGGGRQGLYQGKLQNWDEACVFLNRYVD